MQRGWIDYPKVRRSCGLGAGLLVAGLAVWPLWAHDSPDHAVRLLTSELDQGGATSELFFRRATEHRAMRHWQEAEADYLQAVRLDPDFIQAWIELSRVQLLNGKTEAAFGSIEAALQRVPQEENRAALYYIRSEAHAALGRPRLAVEDNRRAVRLQPRHQEWVLSLSRLLLQSDLPDEAVQVLHDGFELMGSVVLETEWTEALLDAGRYEEALVKIAEPLAASRLRSSWLIRRARALLGKGEHAQAVTDLKEALAEIEFRLKPDLPDLTLLVDQGMALALLGKADSARHALARARQFGADAALCFRLERVLRGQPIPGSAALSAEPSSISAVPASSAKMNP